MLSTWYGRWLLGQSIGPVLKKMGPIGYAKTSVRNYRYSLRNNPEQGSSQLPYRMCVFSALRQLTVLILLLGNLVTGKEKVAHLKTRKCV